MIRYYASALCYNGNKKHKFKIFEDKIESAIWLCAIKSEWTKNTLISDFQMLKKLINDEHIRIKNDDRTKYEFYIQEI